jgi:hypothetical protein
MVNLTEMNPKALLAVWTPKDRSKNYHLVIACGAELPQAYCIDKKIWKTNETVFDSFYRVKMRNYHIYIHSAFQDEIREQREYFREKLRA